MKSSQELGTEKISKLLQKMAIPASAGLPCCFLERHLGPCRQHPGGRRRRAGRLEDPTPRLDGSRARAAGPAGSDRGARRRSVAPPPWQQPRHRSGWGSYRWRPRLPFGGCRHSARSALPMDGALRIQVVSVISVVRRPRLPMPTSRSSSRSPSGRTPRGHPPAPG